MSGILYEFPDIWKQEKKNFCITKKTDTKSVENKIYYKCWLGYRYKKLTAPIPRRERGLIR